MMADTLTIQHACAVWLHSARPSDSSNASSEADAAVTEAIGLLTQVVFGELGLQAEAALWEAITWVLSPLDKVTVLFLWSDV